MAGPSAALSPVIAASTHWLVRAYPSSGADRSADTLAELQARQAVTVAAWLRYPTPVDAELVAIAGPGGSAVLDWRAGSEPDDDLADGEGWRTWVDEVVVSWAACLLADPLLAARAVDSVAAAVPAPDNRPRPRRVGDLPSEFRRLTAPTPATSRPPPCCATRTCSRPSRTCTKKTSSTCCAPRLLRARIRRKTVGVPRSISPRRPVLLITVRTTGDDGCAMPKGSTSSTGTRHYGWCATATP
ncbi:hypothetical protein ACFQFC_39345 [Amorphoplanes digitatis]|uniref:hypothetical protein n=1 Tax=Actinoplanes digitatis TaxID=1868 RepID=UPI0036068236